MHLVPKAAAFHSRTKMIDRMQDIPGVIFVVVCDDYVGMAIVEDSGKLACGYPAACVHQGGRSQGTRTS